MGKKVFVDLLENVWGVATVIYSAVCCFSFLAFKIHPADEVFFQWIGLFLIVLLPINVALILYWSVRRKFWFLFPLIALIANIWYYPSIFRLSLFDDEKNDSRNEIVVATFNVHLLKDHSNGNPVHQVLDMAKGKSIDLLCMQEVPSHLSGDSLLKIFPSYPYISIASSPDDVSGIVVLSKFPILKSKVISFAERPNCALQLDLNIHGKNISLFNCHLQTTNWNQRNLLQPRSVGTYNNKMCTVVLQKKVMEDNFIFRAYQADSISQLIKKSAFPVIVCGDFNDTPASYVYTRMRGDLDDSFRTSGSGYSYTYNYMFRLLKIDYLFYSPNSFYATKNESPNVKFSDHNPVIATLELKN